MNKFGGFLVVALLAASCSSASDSASESEVSLGTPTTPTAAPTTTAAPLPQGGRIAEFSECDMGPMEVKLFVAKTVPANEVKLIEEQVCLSKQLYFDRPGTNWQMTSPLYIALLNRDDSASAVEIEGLYCSYILEHHPTGWSNGKCGPYGGQGCQTSGKCLFTDNSGKVSGSCI